MPKDTAPKKVDLSQFTSLEDALEKVQPGDRYTGVAEPLLGREGFALTYPVLFFFSMISRAEGLHQAIAREIESQNPHAVLPLIRALAESVTLLIYVIDHPEYVEVVAERPGKRPKGAPQRKGMEKLIQYASSHAPGLRHVYRELSEGTHFGSIAMWMSMRIEDEEPPPGMIGTFSWESAPRWRSEEQALIACATTLELADAMEAYLRRFAAIHLGIVGSGGDQIASSGD
jgi:hypothetical protein